MSQPARYIILGLLSAIPIVLIVVINWRWKKVYDERDKQIDHKAVIYSAIGAFIFYPEQVGFYVLIAKWAPLNLPW
ncbi:MAG: hypothetical protein ACYS30_00930 [Planctomycetota bacterium]|jgi:hypothetical protein